MTQPNLFVVGLPRSGTTSVASWLGQHPDVWMSDPKEPAFYATDLRMGDRIGDRDRYLELFEPGGDRRYRGEATPWYLYSTAAAEALRADDPDGHIVILLRDPVDMIASLHNHHRHFGFESEPDLARALTANSKPSDADFRYSLDYMGVALVGEQVARFVDTFPADQVHVIRFEDLAEDPRLTYSRLLEALGLEVIDLDGYPALNPAQRHRSDAVQGALRRLTGGASSEGWRRSLWYRASAMNTASASPAVPASLRAKMLEVLKPDIKLLEDVTGEDLSAWRRQ